MTARPFRWDRLGWLLLLFAVQMLYFPINRLIKGGVILSTPLDPHVPLWPIWVVPYLLSLPWWAACFGWAAFEMDDRRFEAFVVGALAVMLSSYVLYIVFPTYVERPAVEGQGWAADLVRWLYRNDRLNNAFPSGHTYTTMLIVFFWWDWKPCLRWPWAIVATIIILSTLLTGQHNLLDPIGGILWAWGGYRLGMWLGERRARGP